MKVVVNLTNIIFDCIMNYNAIYLEYNKELSTLFTSFCVVKLPLKLFILNLTFNIWPLIIVFFILRL